MCALSVMSCVQRRHGHIEAAAALLNEGSCSPNVTNDNGSTPLHIAAQHGNVYVVELLLSHQELDVVGRLILSLLVNEFMCITCGPRMLCWHLPEQCYILPSSVRQKCCCLRHVFDDDRI